MASSCNNSEIILNTVIDKQLRYLHVLRHFFRLLAKQINSKNAISLKYRVEIAMQLNRF